MQNQAIYRKHHADGLITSHINPGTKSGSGRRICDMTPEQQDAKYESDSFWQDRKREREEWS